MAWRFLESHTHTRDCMFAMHYVRRYVGVAHFPLIGNITSTLVFLLKETVVPGLISTRMASSGPKGLAGDDATVLTPEQLMQVCLHFIKQSTKESCIFFLFVTMEEYKKKRKKEKKKQHHYFQCIDLCSCHLICRQQI